MASFDRQEIQSEASPLYLTRHNNVSIYIGTVLIVLGSGFMAGSIRSVGEGGNGLNREQTKLLIVGVLIGFGGASLLGAGLSARRRRMRQADHQTRHPESRWLWDHLWNSREISCHNAQRTVSLIIGLVVMMLISTLFLVASHSNEDGSIPLRIGGVVSLIGSLLTLLALGKVLVHHTRYGQSRVVLSSFPLFLGEQIQLKFQTGRFPIPAAISFSLRCVEESLAMTTEDGSKSVKHRCEKIYEDCLIRELTGVNLRNGVALDLSFTLPVNREFETRLSQRPVTYWQLVASTEQSNLNYRAIFLLPVYARPAS